MHKERYNTSIKRSSCLNNQMCQVSRVCRDKVIIIIIRALALQRNMWSSRSSSQSSSDTHKLRNAKIASQSALKTP